MQQEHQSDKVATSENSTDSAFQINAEAVTMSTTTANDNVIGADATPPLATPPSKQAQRYQLASKFAAARCVMEAQVSAVVNAKCGQHYRGTFEIRFDNPYEVTIKTLSTVCGNGAVYFTPNDLDQYPALKKLRKAEEGINLSALMSRAKRPSNIDDDSWQELADMWNDVSTTLYSQGLAPMHTLIVGVLAARGLGGPKINKKLCGSLNRNAGNTHEVIFQILDDLNELLIQPPAIS